MKIIHLLSLTALLLSASCQDTVEKATPQTNCSLNAPNHPNAAKYQQIVEKFAQAGAVGVSITIKTPQGTWSNATGKADFTNNVALSPCHTMRIGSISKTFAAATILKLQDEGKLNINDKASKYLPAEYVEKIKNLDKVTLRNLLQHTSGIHEYLGFEGIMRIQNFSAKGLSAKENLRYSFGKKADFEPGTEWVYANVNYILLALVIENITKKTAYEAVTEKIIKPLGLQNTYASTTIPASMSRGYYDTMNNGIMRDQTPIDHNAVGGQDMLDGGMISNSYDLAIFMEALNTGKLLSAKSMADLGLKIGFEVKDIPEELSYIKDYGLGVFQLDIDGKKGTGHAGNVFCFNGIAYYFPAQKMSISILINSYSKELYKVLFSKEVLKIALQ
ncbi:MAG: beta-lactamase family protein [Spirosomaceae bacterium]|jgi:D-alanyl-D-alanine carboxypeptidase|nr:beta-lactamase family protein [Spirosomataceae bacterium]